MEILVYDHETVLNQLPDRAVDSHKGDFGRLLLLCGSVGYTGAAALCAMGALRSGAGLVYVGVPESIYTIEAIKLTEAMVFPLPDKEGRISYESVSKIARFLSSMDAVLMGPGMGCSDDGFQVIKYVLEHFQGPVILDADGINMIAQHKDVLRRRRFPTVLTPHPGEFQRLGGSLAGDRMDAAVNMALDLNCILLLKGHESIITDGMRCICNRTGNPGMATGGSGDMLAGVITALIGQGLPCLEAAGCGAWLAGAAADICAKQIGQYGMLPSDVLEVLPRLIK